MPFDLSFPISIHRRKRKPSSPAGSVSLNRQRLSFPQIAPKPLLQCQSPSTITLITNHPKPPHSYKYPTTVRFSFLGGL